MENDFLNILTLKKPYCNKEKKIIFAIIVIVALSKIFEAHLPQYLSLFSGPMKKNFQIIILL